MINAKYSEKYTGSRINFHWEFDSEGRKTHGYWERIKDGLVVETDLIREAANLWCTFAQLPNGEYEIIDEGMNSPSDSPPLIINYG
jgi:hypothetical protein